MTEPDHPPPADETTPVPTGPVYGTPAAGGPPPPPLPPPPGFGAPGHSAQIPTGPPPAGPIPTGPPPTDPAGPADPSWGTPVQRRDDERQWALFAHLGGVLAFFPVAHLLPALVIYSVYRSRSDFVRDQSREALNFQIVVLIAFFVARILAVLPLFPNLVWAVWLFSLVFAVNAAVVVGRGGAFRYPITYRFLT